MNLIRAEFRKLLSTQVWIWLLVGTVAFSLLNSTITLGFAGNPDAGIPPLDSPLVQPMALQGPGSATIFVVVLGIIGITQEYRHRTATPTFLTTPTRWPVLVAKFVTYLIVGVVFAGIAAVLVYAETAIWIGSTGTSVPLSGDNAKVLFGSAAASALYAVLGVGVGALIRNQVGAIVGFLGYSFVLENLVAFIKPISGLYKFLPGGAARALSSPIQQAEDPTVLLTQWQGAAMLFGYGVVLTVLALVLSTRRDVN